MEKKTPVKPKTQKKAASNQRKKSVSSPVKKKRKKNNNKSDAIKTFILAGALVGVSIIVSSLIIFIYKQTSGKVIEIYEKTKSGTNEILKNDNEFVDNNVVSVQQESENNNVNTIEKKTAPEKNVEPVVPTKNTPVVKNTSLQSGNSTQKQTEQQSGSSTQKQTEQQSGNSTQKQTTPEIAANKKIENIGDLIFVIDDAGNNLRELEPLLSIPYPLTIAVLPGLPNSAEAARRIRAAGKDVFLHQPMEAIGGQPPGPGAIYSGMSHDEIKVILKNNLAEIGPVKGMNNHQGSKITMDKEIMEIVLSFCRENNIIFLDSRTTSETVVPAAAKQMGINIAQRDIFIDNEQDRESMLCYINNGLDRAKKNGSVVMIGHTWSPKLAPLLAEQFPLLIKQGYTIKTVSIVK